MASEAEVFHAIAEGKNAKELGLVETDNPYYQHTVLWFAWMLGFFWKSQVAE